MDSLTVLDSVRIASPCPASWAEMAGDDHVRFCRHCQKNVYNFSAMSAEDAAALVTQTEGRLCARFYRRRDGRMLTADCPVGARAAARGRFRRMAACAIVGLGVLVTGAFARGSGRAGLGMHWEPPPSGPGVTLADWSDWALEVLGIRARPVVAGAISCVPTPTPPPPGSGPAQTPP